MVMVMVVVAVVVGHALKSADRGYARPTAMLCVSCA